MTKNGSPPPPPPPKKKKKSRIVIRIEKDRPKATEKKHIYPEAFLLKLCTPLAYKKLLPVYYRLEQTINNANQNQKLIATAQSQ